jgi:hypothetical protein
MLAFMKLFGYSWILNTGELTTSGEGVKKLEGISDA